MSDSELQWVEAPPVRPSQPSTTDSARRRSHSPSTSSRKNSSRRDDGRRSRTHDDHDDREDRRRRDRSRSRDRDREGGRSGRDAERERDRDRDGDRDRDRSRSRDRRRDRSPSRDRDSRRDRDGGRASKSHRSSRRRSRSRSRSDSDSDGSDMSETRSERRARKKEKKERKREKKEKKKAASTIGEWGKYGLIDDNDREHKENEFRAWMVEERKINPETIKKDRERKEWAAYVEDFNTATLPHLKYVNMAAHMAKMDAIRSGGTYDEFGSSSYDPNADMAAHSNALRRPVVETETYLSQAQLAELRRVQNERIEMGKRKTLGLEVKRDLGVRMDGSKFDKR